MVVPEQKINQDPESNNPVKEIEIRIVKTLLDLIILNEIKNKKGIGGYDVILLVNKEFGIPLSSGTIYSVLYSIERKGLVKGILIGRRTGYALTPKGEQALNKIQMSKNQLQKFINNIFPH